jgi:hypothetical protein
MKETQADLQEIAEGAELDPENGPTENTEHTETSQRFHTPLLWIDLCVVCDLLLKA